MKMIRKYNEDTNTFENIQNTPMSDSDVKPFLKKLKKWDKEDGVVNKYKVVTLKLL